MSYIGKNIKKIRGIKSLSQQAFAELFDLKRATLGAYEEERSEPKIETIINIANYFSIPIDDLLTKELTVNQLLKFKGELTVGSEEIQREVFPKIPLIHERNESDYLLYKDKKKFVDDMTYLRLPVNADKNFRAFTVTNLEMTNHDQGLFPKDIVIGEWVPKGILKKLNNGTMILVVTDNQFVLRRLFSTKKEIILRADHKSIEDFAVSMDDIKEIWRIRYVFYHRLVNPKEDFEERLQILEEKLDKL